MDRRRLVGALLAAVAACAYGSGPLFVKSVYAAGDDWLDVVYWRFLIGVLLLWTLVLLVRPYRAGLRALSRRQALAALGLGVFFVFNTTTFYAGLQWVSASLASLMIYTYPAMVAVLSIRWGHGLRGRRPWVALAIVLLGVILTVGGQATRAEPIGIALLIVSPIFYAVYILLSARFAGERRGVTAHERTEGAVVPPVVVAAVMLLGTSAVTSTMAALDGRAMLPWQVPPDAVLGLLGIGVVSTALAVSAFYSGSARIGAANASLVATVEPLWTISLAVLLFGESLTAVQVVGGALILGGVILAQTTPGTTVAEIREEP
ncbi:MAG: DMT family transporter [Chloroflexi bacterium]|nr:DMT family transporter [Chloroflexota bacterium]